MKIDLSRLDRVLSAQEILDDAAASGYEEVVIMGLKDGVFYVAKSASASTVVVVGALFQAATRIAEQGWDGA